METVSARHLAFGLLVMLAVGILVWEGYQDTPQFKVYRNRQLGFALDLPSNWQPFYRVRTQPGQAVFYYVPAGQAELKPLFTIAVTSSEAWSSHSQISPTTTRELAQAPDGSVYYATWLPNNPYGNVEGARYAYMSRDITNILNSFRWLTAGRW